MNPSDASAGSGAITEWWQRLVGIPQLAGVLAAIAFMLVVSLSKEAVGQSLSKWQTWYAIAMGLLGSSLFLLYKLAGALRDPYEEKKVGKNLAGLFVGPIAGWLSYFMYVTARSPEGGNAKPIAGTAQIWLPFLAGFSADLMVGIIYQGVRAVKLTLGIDRVGEDGSIGAVHGVALGDYRAAHVKLAASSMLPLPL